MTIARRLCLALLVGLALLPTAARADVPFVNVFNSANVLQTGSSATLDQLQNQHWYLLINNGFDTKRFDSFANLSSPLAASQITVTGFSDGGLDPGPGIVISGLFSAAANTTTDTSLDFRVSVVTPGFLIHDIGLSAQGAVGAGGLITVTETATVNGTTPSVMTLQVPPPGTSVTQDMTLFTPVTSVNIHKDILTRGGTSSVTTLTDLRQRFSQVAIPEPSTMALAAFGALGFVGYGLRRRKARTA